MRQQAAACAALGSPLMARVLTLLAGGLVPGTPLADRLFAWPGDIGPYGASLPLRLAGGLHALVLSGAAPGLARAYRDPATGDATLEAELFATLDAHATFLLGWIESAPQTNEVRRSAVLIAAAHLLDARFGLPLVLSELGASAGLNLLWDHYALAAGGHRYGPAGAVLTLTPDWSGPLPVPAAPRIAARAGVDLNPLSPTEDRLRLLAYLWPDQADRLQRTAAALDLAAREPPPLTRADAIDWLEARLATPQPGHLHLVCHTVAWQYFPAGAQARGTALLDAAGARATGAAPLARLAMEADGKGEGAAVTLQLWPGDLRLTLGRADFHGRWLRWEVGQL